MRIRQYNHLYVHTSEIGSTTVGAAAFSGYLGDADKEAWKHYGAVELLKAYSGPKQACLVDTGTADNFYKVRLPYLPSKP